ncbi:hypothetical protein EM6_1791 [Asticcacaulis excentricus]|uniref:Uncharacterized protein n=2 Tax=Asticcacaulis excentricus TaxID=78587 RepID=A0A3G9G5J8_9CAUL|nr:hypothetical protein EM6_1791 [Asticcacaulis excentricus]
MAALPETPCARVYIDIVPPETFEGTAKITFPKGMFDASPPPAPYNPLGSPNPEA